MDEPNLLVTSATRVAAVVFGGHLSARAAFQLDFESGPAI
jgi:hypothetical protein